MQAISKLLVPSPSAGPKTVQCLHDDQGMPYPLVEFLTRGHAYLLLCLGLEIGIPDIRVPQLQTVELGEEGEAADAAAPDAAAGPFPRPVRTRLWS